MKSLIIGTAGHIDHGKTALVKALTGIDADRLEEEKRRGITIDIGFAHLYLPSPNGETLRLGFVDVPGHERFIRNMLAGVGGIDLVLFVIAADEAIKPQTREHFDICRLLGVRHGITVLTKSDAVDPETLNVVKLEVEEFLRGSFLDTAHSAIVPVSALTGTGITELKSVLSQIALEIPVRDVNVPTRLPIDRVFTMKGFGTVVTGTLVAGAIRAEHQMEVSPQAKHVRVRSVQVHGETTEQAVAGQRTALNLTGVDKQELERGMVLASPDIFKSTSKLDVELALLPSAKPLKDRARVHLHSYTMQTSAEVRLYEKKSLQPGEKSFARLLLAEPALLLPADRFIIRQFSPVTTIGGGIVLDALPLAQKLPPAKILPFLQIMARGSKEEILAARAERRAEAGLHLTDIQAEMNLSFGDAARLAVEVAGKHRLIAGDRQIFISPAAFNQVMKEIVAATTKFHSGNPLEPGIGKEALRDQVNLSPNVFYTAIGKLCDLKQLETQGELVRLPGRGVTMKDEEAEAKKTIEYTFASAGLKVPALKEVLVTLVLDKSRAQKIVTILLRDKVLIKIADDLVFHITALNDLKKQIAAYKARSTKINVAQFKDLTGVSRKYAIPLLEFLDRERVTRRVGDERIIL